MYESESEKRLMLENAETIHVHRAWMQALVVQLCARSIQLLDNYGKSTIPRPHLSANERWATVFPSQRRCLWRFSSAQGWGQPTLLIYKGRGACVEEERGIYDLGLHDDKAEKKESKTLEG